MPRLYCSPLINAITGKWENYNMCVTKYGLVIKKNPPAQKKVTNKQTLQRSNIRTVQNAWHLLSANDLSQWNSFSSYAKNFCKKSPDVLLSGYNLFLKHNLLLLTAGKPIITAIEYFANSYQVTSGGPYSGTGVFGFDLDESFNPLLWVPLLKITKPLRYQLAIGSCKFSVVQPLIIEDFELEIYSQYIELFGRVPLPGEFVWFSVQFLHLKLPISQAPFYNLAII